MSFHRGPKIIQDGLVLYLDAANKKSLVDEPTVNFVPNPTFSDGTQSPWNYQIVANGNISVVSDIYRTDGYSVKLERTNTTSEVNTYYDIGPAMSLKPSTQYTFSADILCNTPGTARLLAYKGSVNGSSPSHSGSGKWERVEVTFTTSATSELQIRFGLYDTTVLATAYFDNIQLEEKTYATTFVNGIRNQWKDLSGNGNDATLYGNPTMNYGIQFNTSGDYQYALSSSDKIMMGNDSIWTIESLFKIDGDPSTGEAFIVGKAGCHAGIMSYSGYRIYNTITTTDCFTGAGVSLITTLAPELWCLSTLTHVGNGLIKRYINGIFVSQQQVDLTTYTLRTHSNSIFIGGYNSANYRSNSEIQIVRCYSKSLNDSEIYQNFNATKSRFL